MIVPKLIAAARHIAPLAAAILIAAGIGCRATGPAADAPRQFLWAWERAEDLRFIDPAETGVAFLAQTVLLENDRVVPQNRKQPLEISPGTYLIAVTRIETAKDTARRPKMDLSMVSKTAYLIARTLELPNVRGVQVDFDAVVSERDFYRRLAAAVREQLDKQPTPNGRISFTITALASWCTGDVWLGNMPIDEAVPMVFQMGADAEKIRSFIANGNDWNEPLCRESYGISTEEGWFEGMKSERRRFLFKNSPWRASDLEYLR